MLALDVARVEAGLLLIEVDYTSSKKALIPSQKFSPYELGFAKMVHLDKENFIGKRALQQDAKKGVPRQLVGLEVDWTDVEQLYERYGLTPAAPTQASRVAVPVYSGEKQVGKATTTTLVSNPEKIGCAGQRRNGICEAGNISANGNYHRGDAPQDQRKGDHASILQSAQEDRYAGVKVFVFMWGQPPPAVRRAQPGKVSVGVIYIRRKRTSLAWTAEGGCPPHALSWHSGCCASNTNIPARRSARSPSPRTPELDV